MAPTTRASIKRKAQTVIDKADTGKAENSTAKKIQVQDKAQDRSQAEACQVPDNTPTDDDNPFANLTYEEMDWMFWFPEIEAAAIAAARDPRTVFFDSGHYDYEGHLLFYYTLNGALFVARNTDGRQPWRWPMVQVDPATLGLPYDPATNADDSAMGGLTVAVDHAYLYNDAVYIKDLFHPIEPQTERWEAEVRMYERLSRQHPHPNIVRYLGCRVIEVPDHSDCSNGSSGSNGTGATRQPKIKRITGIVLERVERCLADYDADAPAFRDLDVDLVLDRLDATLAFLHGLGLAHNDVKPANVMVRDDGQPVLIDFESCAPPGTKLPTRGTEGWCESHDTTSRIETDLYAMKKMRERIRDKDAVEQYFQGTRVRHWGPVDGKDEEGDTT